METEMNMELELSSRPKLRSDKDLSFEDKVREVEKKRVKKTYHPKLPQNRKRKGVYDMTAVVRGHCLIIANTVFKSSDDKRQSMGHLPGYVRDAEILNRVFTELSFNVTVEENKSGEDIKTIIKNVSQKGVSAQDEKPNAFILIILSHGLRNSILGADQKHVKLSEIIDILDNGNCDRLRDRPKLIFVQACQGVKEDYGVTRKLEVSAQNGVVHVAATINGQDEEVAIPACSKPKARNVTDSQGSEPGFIPTTSDMLICFSTISGYRSYVKNEGSIFGIALARALINHAFDTDLQGLLNLISSEMKEETTKIKEGVTGKQIPQVTLKGWTKLLYFNPGYPKPHNDKPKNLSNRIASKKAKKPSSRPIKKASLAGSSTKKTKREKKVTTNENPSPNDKPKTRKQTKISEYFTKK